MGIIPSMANTTRESVELEGLVIVTRRLALSEQGRARDAAGLPTSAADEDVIETCFEPIAGEPVEQMLARVGFEEHVLVTFRCKTRQEEIQPVIDELARLVKRDVVLAALDRSLHTVNGQPEVVRDADGRPAPFESFPRLSECD
jgi:hypothetical protein